MLVYTLMVLNTNYCALLFFMLMFIG